jgi:hypothetical protein
VLRRGLMLRYPRLPHSALVCWPGLLFTETTSLDSGSMRHMASTRLQASWARSFKPNWRRSSPEPNVASLPVETEEGEGASISRELKALTYAHFGHAHDQFATGGFFNRAFGHAKFCARDNREFACGRVRQLREGQQS